MKPIMGIGIQAQILEAQPPKFQRDTLSHVHDESFGIETEILTANLNLKSQIFTQSQSLKTIVR